MKNTLGINKTSPRNTKDASALRICQYNLLHQYIKGGKNMWMVSIVSERHLQKFSIPNRNSKDKNKLNVIKTTKK